MRLFRSTTCPSTWRAHGSSGLFALVAFAAGLAGELADRYATRRETPPGWPSIKSVILEHSVQNTTSHAIPRAKLMPRPMRPGLPGIGDGVFGVIDAGRIYRT
jgi:hypothetical protein